jgi:hypothetical protein
MLYARLDSNFDTHETDNLVSWTSSLLVAIQYAIFRCHTGLTPGKDAGAVLICAVDTARFPRGQFVRDMHLIRRYRRHADADGEAFFGKLRCARGEFYNGEFVSQGVLHHAGRAVVVSLRALEQAGLYALYPEFRSVKGRSMWAKRLRGLRDEWRDLPGCAGDTASDAARALGIARECFAGLDERAVAAMLLCFRNRGPLSPGGQVSQQAIQPTVEGATHMPRSVDRCSQAGLGRPDQYAAWSDAPVEVCRFSRHMATGFEALFGPSDDGRGRVADGEGRSGAGQTAGDGHTADDSREIERTVGLFGSLSLEHAG